MSRGRGLKSFVAAIGSLVLLAGTAAVAAPAAAADAPVIPIAGFEGGTVPPPWQQSGGPAIEVVEVEGDPAALIAGRANDYDGLQTAEGALADLEPGSTYTFSMRVRLAAGTPGAANLRWVMKPDFTWIANADATADAWTTVSGTWAVPASADPATLQVYIGSGPIGGVDSPPASYDYLVDDLSITGPLGGGPGDPGGSVALSTDFESGLDGWAPREAGGPGHTVTITTDEVHAGEQAALVSGRDDQGDGIGHDVTGVLEGGQSYRFTAWVRFAAGQPVGDVWLSLAHTTAGVTTYSTLSQFTGLSNSQWTQVAGTFQMPVADSALIYLETAFGVENTSEFLVDDIAVTQPHAEVQDLLPIKDTLDVPVGVAIDSRETTGSAAELLLRHFDQITPENHMKPEAWYDAERNFTVHPETVAMMDFAAANDLAVYGHTLVWHSQTPAWIFQDDAGQPLTNSDADRAVLRERMRAHVFAVAEALSDTWGEFGGGNPITAFDVVNEVIADGSEFDDDLRRSEWYRILGEEFVALAFEYADEAFNDVYAAPGSDRPVTLFINDYNTEQPGKSGRLHALVERLLDAGVPVDGVGHQFHVNLSLPVSALEQALAAFEGLGLEQAVTEFDVTTGTPATEARLIEQGYYYRDAFRVFRAFEDDLFSITVWGLTDGRSWRSSSGAPLVFDDSLQAKPAYHGIVDGELPDRMRTADVFAGEVAIGPDAASAIEWRQLPLHPIAGGTGFQARWAADHLTVFVSVDDATADAADGLEFVLGEDVHTFGRDGTGDVDGVATERSGGYDAVVRLPADGLAAGATLAFDVRVRDGEDATGWNSDGALGTLTLVEPLSYLEVAAAASAPVIDGEIDDVWAEAGAVSTLKEVEGGGGAIATVRTLWSGSTLYVLAEVVDPVIDLSGSDPWVQDSVEIYVDAGNAKAGAYRADDTQIRVNAANVVSFGTGDPVFQDARVESATATTDDGYLVEVSVSLLEAGGADTFHGLDFQVNDASGGVRTAIRNWADPTGAGYQSTARWGVGRLLPAETAEPSIELGAATVRAGGAVTVALSGFEPGTEVDLVLSDPTAGPSAVGAPRAGSAGMAVAAALPTSLATVTIGSDGSGAATVTIPASLAAGDYRLAAVVGGAPLATADLVVLAADGPGGGLATSGSEPFTVAALALLLASVGVLLALARWSIPARRSTEVG